MKRAVGAVVVALVAAGWAAPAAARPPALLMWPGYEARLAESRKAYADQYERWSLQQAHKPVKAPAKQPRRALPRSPSH